MPVPGRDGQPQPPVNNPHKTIRISNLRLQNSAIPTLSLVRESTMTRQVIDDLTLSRNIRLYAKSPHPSQHLRFLLDSQADVPLERGLRLVS